ncbi:MAG: DUF3455 domain-containing protein [Actinomycetes bacterium]
MEATRRSSRFIVALAGALAVCGLLAATASAGPVPQTSPPDPLDPRTTAPESRLFLVTHAIGFQTYQCNATGSAWTFTGPLATLYKTTGTSKPIGTHFRNPVTTRPVWQLKDGSSVEATAIVTVPAGIGNIPSLLLQAAATAAGPDGDRLTSTTFIQRLNTTGGIAPAGACTPGASVAVPYTADYFFWRAGGENDG